MNIINLKGNLLLFIRVLTVRYALLCFLNFTHSVPLICVANHHLRKKLLVRILGPLA